MLKYDGPLNQNCLDIYSIQYKDIERFEEFEIKGKAIRYIDGWGEEAIVPMSNGYDVDKQTELFNFIRDIICQKYKLKTEMDGMLHNQIPQIDDFINNCNPPLDFYGEKIPAADAIFGIHKPLYTIYAQAFLENEINNIINEILDIGKCEYNVGQWSFFANTFITYTYLFELVNYNYNEE